MGLTPFRFLRKPAPPPVPPARRYSDVELEQVLGPIRAGEIGRLVGAKLVPLETQQPPMRQPPLVRRGPSPRAPGLLCAYCGRDRSRDSDASCPGCGASEYRESRDDRQPSLIVDPQIVRLETELGDVRFLDLRGTTNSTGPR